MSFEALQIAASVLGASRLGVETAGQNLAGADRPGYTRQRAVVVDLATAGSPNGRRLTGLGVRTESLARIRSALLDGAYRLRHREAESARVLDPLLEELESGLTLEASLPEHLSDFQNALATLSAHPADTGVRQAVLGHAQSLADSFRRASGRLEEVTERTGSRLGELTTRGSEILAELARLNASLGASPGGTSGANAMLDQRDRLLDELSGLADVRVLEQEGGTVHVYLDGRRLVFGDRSEALVADAAGRLATSSGTPLRARNGALAALGEALSVTLPGLKDRLEGSAATLISEANSVHRSAYGLDGVAGRDLFRGTGAGDLELALSDPRHLGAAAAHLESPAPVADPGLDPGAPLSTQAGWLIPPGSSGVLEVNGQAVPWDDTRSLDEVLARFAGAGALAVYDPVTRRVTVDRDVSVPGPAALSIQDQAGSLAAALGLDGASWPAVPAGGQAASRLLERLDQPRFGAPADRSLEHSLQDLVVEVGRLRQEVSSSVQEAERGESTARSLRQSEAGVSSDEELMDVVKLQQAFAAAARVAAAADEMLSTLIRQTGR